MNHRVPTVLLVAVTAVVAGCGLLGNGGADAAGVKGTSSTTTGLGDATGTPTEEATTEPTPDATDRPDLPDVCTLLTEGEVRDLTGRAVTEVDTDGADGGASVRYCQWQQESGQLAVFLAHTTEADFDTATTDGTPVDGIGDKAAELAGHLYVLYGGAQFDVYVRGDSDDENLVKAKKVVEVLIGRI
jgi:hypothetical protein